MRAVLQPTTTPRAGGAPDVMADAAAAALPTVRLLHTSDLHVGERAGGVAIVGAVVDAAIERAAGAVLLVGDTFDHNRITTAVAQEVVDQLARLGDVPVVVLPGNHDCLIPDSVWRRVEVPTNVHVLTDSAGELLELDQLTLALWGRPHADFGDLRPLAGVPVPEGHRWHVALAHGHLVLHPGDEHRAYQITPEEIAACAHDYVALGHWDVPHDMSAGGVCAHYSGSGSRFGVCALATLRDDGVARRVDVERVELAPM
jgi:DNA repair exonuclease SbcCD nuclease subunit